jgi:thiamine biosynthesis protein ThiI
VPGAWHTDEAVTNTADRSGGRFLRLVPSGEVYLKSRRTRDRFMRGLVANLRAGLDPLGIDTTVRRSGHHELSITSGDPAAAAEVASRTFGVNRVELVEPIAFDDLDRLAEQVAERSRPRVADRTFAVRVRRRGSHDWGSKDAEIEIGALLLDDSAGVDLGNPEITVGVHVRDDAAYLVADQWPGADGLPAGTQRRVLVLISGGIDSPVAAWMMMRRGCPVDYLHLKLDCSVSDHALVVADELVRRWGHGASSRFHVVDFQGVKDQLRDRLPPRIRQVVLKQLMLEAAAEVARRSGIQLLVTGDSLGQVSSQTAAHLAEIDQFVGYPILRPLVAMTKEEIVARSRSIGTYELSIRAREVCDLSEGRPVETQASASRLERGHERLESSLVASALEHWESIEAPQWVPGVPLEPVAVD